jgi:hypothetical protein
MRGHMTAIAGIMVLAVLARPATVRAQDDQEKGSYIEVDPPRTHEWIVITENVGYVPSLGRGFTDETLGHLSDGRTTRVGIAYDMRHAITGEVGAVVMFHRMWGAGVVVGKWWSENIETTTTLSMFPGESLFRDGYDRKETAHYIEATRVLIRREGQPDPFGQLRGPTGYVIRIFGGPVYYKTKQDIFAPRVGEVTMHEGTGWGYHAGLDASMYAAIPGLGGGGIGFGGTVRYSNGSVRLPGLLNEAPSGRPAGGWNFGGGIRFRI